MFSTAHLLDWLNIHLLISPFGLPLIIMTLVTIYRFQLTIFERQTDKDYGYFLSLTAAMYVLAGYLLIHTLTNNDKLREAGLFAMAVSLLPAGTWIFANTHELPRE